MMTLNPEIKIVVDADGYMTRVSPLTGRCELCDAAYAFFGKAVCAAHVVGKARKQTKQTLVGGATPVQTQAKATPFDAPAWIGGAAGAVKHQERVEPRQWNRPPSDPAKLARARGFAQSGGGYHDRWLAQGNGFKK